MKFINYYDLIWLKDNTTAKKRTARTTIYPDLLDKT